MKRQGNIFDSFVSEENLFRAYQSARNGKGKQREVIEFERDIQRNIATIRRSLVSGQWRVHPYKQFVTFERGKQRVIDWDPSFIDNVIQHAAGQTAGPVLLKSMIRDTYAGIRGRGIHDGVERMKGFLSEYLPVHPVYVMKTDIRQFYPSVDHEILKRKLERKIKDVKMLDVLYKIIDSHSPGLPIGNYLSQLFANFYLSDYDHWVKSQGFRHYARYCDDVVVLHCDKDVLRELLMQSIQYLAVENLTVKSNFQVFPIERPGGIDFLGYVFTRKRVLLRKTIERKIRRLHLRHHRGGSIKTLKSLGSYWGWIKWLTNGRRFWYRLFDTDYKTMYRMEAGKCRI